MKNNTFITTDLYETAILLACGYKLIESNRKNDSISFAFNNKDDCEDTIKKYFTNDLQVKARDLVESIRTIKSYIFRK
jgi:hypothetical protein